MEKGWMNIIISATTVCILAMLCLLGSPAPALPAEMEKSTWTVDAVLSKIKNREQTLETFVAGVQQIQNLHLFHQPQISEGMLFFHRSGSLLMRMEKPETYFVLITGRKMITGAPGAPLRQKNLPGKAPFFKQVMGLDQTVDQLKRRFAIQMLTPRDETTCELELRPLKKNRRIPFTRIQATVNTRLWLPTSIRLEESSGDRTTIHLQFISVNEPLPAGIFDIEVPDKKRTRPAGSHDIK